MLAAAGSCRFRTIKILRRLGCEEIGFMDKFETQQLLLYFTHNLKSAQGRIPRSSVRQ
jgi:hypothetical protein